MSDLTPDELAQELRLPGGGEYVMRRVRKQEWPHLKYSSRVIRFAPEDVDAIRALVKVSPGSSSPEVNVHGRVMRGKR